MEDGLERSDKTLVHLVATAKRRKSDVPEGSNESLFNSYGNLFPSGNKRPIDSLDLPMNGPDYWPNSKPLAIKHKSEANEEEGGVSTSQEEGMERDGFRISCICQALTKVNHPWIRNG